MEFKKPLELETPQLELGCYARGGWVDTAQEHLVIQPLCILSWSS